MRNLISLSLKHLLPIFFVILSIQTAVGQNYRFENEKYVEPLTSWLDTPLVEVSHNYWDAIKTSGPAWYTNQKFKSLDNYVALGIKHKTLTKVEDFSLKFRFKVVGFNSKDDSTTLPLEINLTYKKDSLEAYQDLHLVRLADTFHYFKIYLNQVVKNDANNTVLDLDSIPVNVFLEGRIFCQHYEISVPNSSIPYSSCLAIDDKLRIAFDFFPKQSMLPPNLPQPSMAIKPGMYEFEWMYIDNYNVSNYGSGSSVDLFTKNNFNIKYDFRNNATRVQSTHNFYDIPLVYGKGVIIFRARLIRPKANNYTDLEYSSWSLPDTGILTQNSFSNPNPLHPFQRFISSSMYFIDAAFAQDKVNWMHSLSFAEEGKQKSVVSYFDGVGTSRQVQTRITSDPGYVIVAEQIYDKEGRPSISTLPIPMLSNDLLYKNNMSINAITGQPYRADDFDKGCANDSIAGFAPSSLANLYYSPDNPDKVGMQKFVPDAEGYPFVETIYSPDATNKVLWQGGAGKSFQRTGHGTSYAYVTANQKELNRYFGSELGYFQYYPKQFIIDPNGQSSISIMSPSGKVVLTGLTGNSPDSTIYAIKPLNSVPSVDFTTFDVLNGAIQDIGKTYRNFSYAFLPEGAGTNSYKYSGQITPYTTGCTDKFIKVSGYYNLRVTTECGDTVVQSSGQTAPTFELVNVATPYAISDSLRSFDPTIDRHVLAKELYFLDTTLMLAAKAFTQENIGYVGAYCYADSNAFIRTEIQKQSFPCDTPSVSNECDMLKQALMDDLYPGSKYGMYNKGSDNKFIKGDTNSIFSLYSSGGQSFTVIPNNERSSDPLYRLNVWYSPWDSCAVNSNNAIIFNPFKNTYFACPVVTQHWNSCSDMSFEYSVWVPENEFPDCFSFVNLSLNQIPYYLNRYSSFPVNYNPNIKYNGIISGPLDTLKYAYRYQLPCLGTKKVYVGHIWPGQYPNDSLAISAMEPDQLIAAFNEEIAAYLLPLHPEYCKLAACDPSGYLDTLALIEDWNDAVFLGRETLDKIALADPMNNTNNVSAPFNTFALKNISTRTGLLKIDSFAVGQTYTSNSLGTIVDTGYNKHIIDLDVTNKLEHQGFYKDVYIKNLISAYRGNRMLRTETYKSGQSNTCGPCEWFRLNLVGNPTIPTTLSSNGELSNEVDVEPWFRELYNNNVTGNPSTSVPTQLTNEIAANNAHLCDMQLDEVVKGLKHCLGGLTTANANSIKQYIRNNCPCNDSKGATITPEIVKNAIESVLGAPALNELCNPYLITYNKYNNEQKETSKDYLPYAATYYDQAKLFVNRILDAKTANASQVLLDPVSSAYEAALASTLGLSVSNTHQVTFSYWETNVNVENKLQVIITLTNGANTEQLYIAPNFTKDFTSACTANFTVLPFVGGVRFTSGTSILQNPLAAYTTSVFMQNAMLLTGDAANPNACFSYVLWHRYAPMQQINKRQELGDAITCVDIKSAVNDYLQDATTYKYSPYVNSATGRMALKNYLNHRFDKQLGITDYTNLMEGCFLSDSLVLPTLQTEYELTFTNAANYNAFRTAFANYFRDTVALNGFVYYAQPNTSSTVVMELDMKQFEYNYWGEVRKFINMTNTISQRNYMKQLPAGNLAQVWLANDNACTNSFPYTASTYYLPLINDSFATIKRYDIPHLAGNTPMDYSNALALVWNQVEAIACPKFGTRTGVAFMRSSATNTAEHARYLQHIYALGANNASNVVVTSGADRSQLGNVFTINGAIYNNSMFEPFSYINAFDESNIANLYYTTVVNTTHTTFLSDILAKVTSNGTQSLYMASRSRTIVPAGLSYGGVNVNSFMSYHTADGGIWFRLFDERDRRYNVYVKSSGTNLVPMQNYKPIPNTIKAKPANGDMYTFTMQMRAQSTVNNAVWDTITCYGYTDFALGTGASFNHVMISSPIRPLGSIDTMTCEDQKYDFAIGQGILKHRRYADSIVNYHYSAMKHHFPNNTKDTLELKTTEKKYHFTAYYYDIAGNLTRTVPPEGIESLSAAQMTSVDNNRTSGSASPYVPTHTKVSKYKYNTLNQLVWQVTPDGDTATFYYDKYGRIVFSQNAKQRALQVYAYTLYDNLSRIEESGQVKLEPAYLNNVTASGSKDGAGDIKTDVRRHPRKYVTTTIYDYALLNLENAEEGTNKQDNLQNRVSSILYAPNLSNIHNATSYFAHASHFSYDVLGNVKTIVQDRPNLEYLKQRFKRIDYDFDYLSGKVNMLSYNRGRADQYYQRYEYDADNRITEVFTSNDGVQWDKDATYTYYKHGPLAAMQLGDEQVQQVQYAYTIQGWLKAINGDVLNAAADMGTDGLTNPMMPKDVFAHALTYHQDDYKAIGTHSFMKTAGNTLETELYNGNIARQTTAIHGISTGATNLQRNYQYDQLNRLVSTMYAEVNNADGTVTPLANNGFQNSYSYDADGNIKTLMRRDGAGTVIDNFQYHYQSPNNNKLDYVTDDPSTPIGGNDLQPGQLADNYAYDESGNLIADAQGGLHQILWNAMGKVDAIRDTVTGKYIAFYYDGTGQRVRKDVLQSDAVSNGDLSTDLYVRDAQGNILATYKQKSKIDNTNFIPWLNQSIIDQHPTWQRNAPKGLPLFLSTIGIAENAQFRTQILNAPAVLSPWGENYVTQNFEVYDFAVHSELVKDAVFQELPFKEFFQKMRSDYSDDFVGEIANNVVLAQQVILPHLTPAENVHTGVVDSNLMYFLEKMKTSSEGLSRQWATNIGLDMDYNTLDGFTDIMYNYLVSDPTQVPHIVESTLPLHVGSDEIKQLFIEVLADDNCFQEHYFTDALKIEANSALFSILQSENALQYPVLNAGIAIKNSIDPNWFENAVPLNDKLSIAYNINATDFVGTLLTDGHKTVIDDAVTAVYRVTTESGVVSVKWVGYMNDILTEVRRNNGSLSGTYTPPTVNLSVPDYILKDTLSLAEHHLYGSSRLGVKSYPDTLIFSAYDKDATPGALPLGISKKTPWYSWSHDNWVDSGRLYAYVGNTSYMFRGKDYRLSRYLGLKHYELTDHLGNVNVAVLDKISGTGTGNAGEYAYLSANISSFNDYYPFGMPMPGRNGSLEKYRFGFNGQERTDEVYGKGNLNTALFWEYDTRLGRRWNLDPVDQISISNYAVNGLNPILNIDPNGDWYFVAPVVWGAAEWFLFGAAVTTTSVVAYNAINTPDFTFNPSYYSPSISTRVELPPTNYLATKVDARTAVAVEVITGEKLKNQNEKGFYHVTYQISHNDGRVYTGRTSGHGTPTSLVEKRMRNHHMVTEYGFISSTAIPTMAVESYTGSFETRYMDPAYWFIRGAEEGGITLQKTLGKNGNQIKAISDTNKSASLYRETFLLSIGTIPIRDDDNCVTCASDKRTKSK